MNDLECLYDFADGIGITVHDFRIKGLKKAACFHTDDIRAVVLDKPRIETSSEEKCILAEEIGHYETNSLYYLNETMNAPLARENRRKAEYQAKAWRAKKILPPDDLQTAIYKCVSIYDLSEYLNVTMTVLNEAFEYYWTQGIEFNLSEIE
jgi:hypothetical protein